MAEQHTRAQGGDSGAAGGARVRRVGKAALDDMITAIAGTLKLDEDQTAAQVDLRLDTDGEPHLRLTLHGAPTAATDGSTKWSVSTSREVPVSRELVKALKDALDDHRPDLLRDLTMALAQTMVVRTQLAAAPDAGENARDDD